LPSKGSVPDAGPNRGRRVIGRYYARRPIASFPPQLVANDGLNGLSVRQLGTLISVLLLGSHLSFGVLRERGRDGCSLGFRDAVPTPRLGATADAVLMRIGQSTRIRVARRWVWLLVRPRHLPRTLVGVTLKVTLNRHCGAILSTTWRGRPAVLTAWLKVRRVPQRSPCGQLVNAQSGGRAVDALEGLGPGRGLWRRYRRGARCTAERPPSRSRPPGIPT
jgi:hypothetical protein